jgi:CheY-like chemotaxis protein
MARSLEGNLEDLELAEVLRVIALSRRSGTLSIEGRHESAEVRVAVGRIHAVRSSFETTTLAEVLLEADALLPNAFAHAEHRSLDDLLRAEAAATNDAGLFARVEQAITVKLTEVLAKLLEWSEGHFKFSTEDGSHDVLRFAADTTYALSDGIDGEKTVRTLRQRRGAPRRDAPRRPRLESAAKAGPQAQEILIVEDDPSALAAIEQEARAAGLEVTGADGARAAIEALSRLVGRDDTVALIDLVMPRSNGKGILGGLEVLQRAEEFGLVQHCFLTIDAPHDDAVAFANALGVAGIIERPRPGEPLSSLLNPALTHLGRPPLVDQPIDLAAEIMRETGETEWAADPDQKLDESARNLEVLRSLLAQVSNPTFEDEIPLLLLRFAAAFFARGALFAHHAATGQLVGIGGFGFASSDPGRAIHAVQLPSSADTVFTRAIRERTGVRQPYFDSAWNTRVLAALGGPRPTEVYTAPLLSPRGLEAVLYADNATTGRPFPDTMLLEIFVQQAGVALERSSLVRRVDELLRARTEVRA